MQIDVANVSMRKDLRPIPIVSNVNDTRVDGVESIYKESSVASRLIGHKSQSALQPSLPIINAAPAIGIIVMNTPIHQLNELTTLLYSMKAVGFETTLAGEGTSSTLSRYGMHGIPCPIFYTGSLRWMRTAVPT